MKKLIYLTLILSILIVVSCKQKSTHSHGGGGDAHEEDANKEEVHLLKKQMDVMGIKLGNFQFLNLSTTVKSNGQLELPPQNQSSLSSVMGGRVKSINVLEGDYVKKGQTLALLEHPDFIEMQEQYMKAWSKLKFQEKDYLRKKLLFEDSVSSEKDYQMAESEYMVAKATVGGLRAKLALLNIDISAVESGKFISAIPIRSPINGFIKHIEINMGKFVKPEDEMFEIVDNEHIHIDLMVYEKDLDKVKNGQKVIFSLTNNPDSVFQGSIFAVGKSFEQEPKALFVHAEIDNKMGNLLPGMYVDARIVTNEERVQSLPNEAIVSDGGLNYIFVLKSTSVKDHHHDDGDEHEHGAGNSHDNEYVFKKVEVSTGATDIGFTEVVPADVLAEDVQIVTKGAFYLLAEMKKGEGGHGHHH